LARRREQPTALKRSQPSSSLTLTPQITVLVSYRPAMLAIAVRLSLPLVLRTEFLNPKTHEEGFVFETVDHQRGLLGLVPHGMLVRNCQGGREGELNLGYRFPQDTLKVTSSETNGKSSRRRLSSSIRIALLLQNRDDKASEVSICPGINPWICDRISGIDMHPNKQSQRMSRKRAMHARSLSGGVALIGECQGIEGSHYHGMRGTVLGGTIPTDSWSRLSETTWRAMAADFEHLRPVRW
jgi:hypothetical protein